MKNRENVNNSAKAFAFGLALVQGSHHFNKCMSMIFRVVHYHDIQLLVIKYHSNDFRHYWSFIGNSGTNP